MKIVIVGGGAIGLSLAYHLGKAGADDVTLFERNTLTSGTSWHAAGIVGPLRATPNMTRLALYATDLFSALEQETGQATGYRQTGGFWLAQTEDRMTELRRIAAMGLRFGLTVDVVSPSDIAKAAPFIRVDDLKGGLRVAEDGQVNPVDLCMAYAKGARAAGVVIKECAGVETVIRHGGRVAGVVLADGRQVECDVVANCAGAWSRGLGALSGVSIPAQAVEHMYVVSDAVPDIPDPVPILRDLDARIYLKGDAGKLVLGGFEPDAKPWHPERADPGASFLQFDEDWEQFGPFMEAGLHRAPILESVGIQHFMNGPESFTPDTRQVMGEAPDLPGYFVAAGFNSIGIMSSAGVGRALARWIVDGEAPMDLWEVEVARTDAQMSSPRFLRQRMREAVSNQFDMHWPLKQPKTGRFVRRSPLHRSFGDAGAVFGNAAGWERPFWFARTPAQREYRYSYGPQCWWPYARREAETMADGVALVELSPFTKLDITGPNSLACLQRICANDVSVAPGRTVYTQMLNRRGGIEADVTVTRCGEFSFRVVSGAPTRRRDHAWLCRHVPPGMSVSIHDASSSEAVIGVMGPRSRELLQSVSDSDLSAQAFRFGHSRLIDLGMTVVRATRQSFVGELGWEIYVAVEFAEYVYETLVDAGRTLELGYAGHLCVDGCRLEKGFRHWGHDIGPDVTPLEAGLGFAVSRLKGDFIGVEAIQHQREEGVAQHLVLLQVAAGPNGPPLLLHDELVREGGHVIGLTTSGGLGPRTGQALAFGLLECEPGTSRRDLRNREYAVEVAGIEYPARALEAPPYDPDGSKMRG